jgi:hypothetical protein
MVSKEDHKWWQIIHRDFGTYVLEFCCAHKGGCYKRRIYGDEAKEWQEKLATSNRLAGEV